MDSIPLLLPLTSHTYTTDTRSTSPGIIEDNEEYEVEGISDHMTNNNRREYLAQWQGFPRDGCTWELEDNQTHCKRILNKFKCDHCLRL
ncbi:hypothetical protein BGX24_009827 [Mortierella sp. AD032]|nr:hypothetical protein BGX24_009827 [Mortierella sp. AD032]